MLTITAAIAIPAALSWACGPQAGIYPDRSTYAPGDVGHIAGTNFLPGAQFTINIEGGPTLASVTIPQGQNSFSVSFTVPSTAGDYVLRVIGTDPQGNALPPSPQTIRVAAPLPTTVPNAAPSESAPAAATPAPAQSTSPATSRPSTREEASATVKAPARSARPATRTRPNAAGTAPAASTSTASTPAVFAGSVPRTGAATQKPVTRTTRRAAGTSRAPTTATRPSESTASAPGWSGLGAGASPALVPNGSFPATASTGNATARTLSILMLGLGLAALAGGVGVTELRRRRSHGD